MKPVFSIIVVTYNRNKLLAECLESFKRQTFSDFEVIVIDRGSEPSAKSVVDSVNDERFVYKKSSQDVHFCDVINNEVKDIKGRYLCVFGDDDVINENALEFINLTFEKNPDCAIAILGSVTLSKKEKEEILIPSHFSNKSDFPYFKPEVLITKFSGKDWFKYVCAAQYIGKGLFRFPSYVHPSTCFLRKDNLFDSVYKKQGGIAVKPSFDAGYLGLASKSKVVFINAPLCVITFNSGNVSVADRRIWNREIKDLKYMPKISNLENRGADSLLSVVYKNGLEKEFDLRIQLKLYRIILKSIERDPVWDRQTLKDYIRLFWPYFKASKIKVDVVYEYLRSFVHGAVLHVFFKHKLKKIEKKLDCLTALQVNNSVNTMFNNQFDIIRQFLNKNPS